MSSKNALQLTLLAAADLAAGDLVVIGDVSASGNEKTKAMTRAELHKAVARFFVPIAAAGDLVATREYGYFKARIVCKIVGIDWTVGDLPQGDDALIFDLTKLGVAQARLVEIAEDADPYGQEIFNTAITLAVGDTVRLKVTQTGDEAPGAYLNANLIIEPIVA